MPAWPGHDPALPRLDELRSRGALTPYTLSEVLRDDGELVLARATQGSRPVLLVVPSGERLSGFHARTLRHEFELRTELDIGWAAQPLALTRNGDNLVLVLDDPGGVLLEQVPRPLGTSQFLRVARAVAGALGRAHQRGLVHKDIRPANVLVDMLAGTAVLTGFGLASRQAGESPPSDGGGPMPGSLPYMAPEQSGRMNRAVDSRSDLYSLGVTLYQLLTDALPFDAADEVEWVHSHVARRPRPPAQRADGIPEQISAIVMRLLAKNAEERYQTAAGLEADLDRCLTRWLAAARVDPFPLALDDTPDRLVLPQWLYGRDRDVAEALDAFERVSRRATPELVLVSGHAGIGKSALVAEVRAALPTGVLFAAGSFDAQRRDVPHQLVTQIVGSVLRHILSGTDDDVQLAREAVLAAVGSHGRLVGDLVPELGRLIGEQPPVIAVLPQETHNRFLAVFRRCMAVFASAERPLVVYLDDVQWMDVASLELLAHFVTHPDLRHVLVIGTSRIGEAAPPAVEQTLEAIRRSDVVVREIVLEPLSIEAMGELVAHALQADLEQTRPLATLVHAKSAGNPLFGVQFLTALADDGLLSFDRDRRGWEWDLDQIQARGFADSVVDLVVGRLSWLPTASREAVGLLACMGSAGDAAQLARLLGVSERDTDLVMRDALRTGLVLQVKDSYVFAHARIHEAAYALLPPERHSREHLRIGRLLLGDRTDDLADESVFDVTNQLNLGLELVTSPEERAVVSRLNVVAGRQARASGAYGSARNYLAQATALLPEDVWDRDPAGTFLLYLELSESEYLSGNFERADELFDVILAAASSDSDRARVLCLRARLYQLSGRYDEAIGVVADGLRIFGIELPHTDEAMSRTQAQLRAHIRTALAGREVRDLIDAPVIEDAGRSMVILLLADAIHCAYATQPELFAVITEMGLQACLTHGVTPDACRIFLNYGALQVTEGDVATGFEFAELALALNERFDDRRIRGALLHTHAAYVNPWRRHLATSRPMQEQSFALCVETGDFVFAGYAIALTMSNAVARSDPLDDVLELCRGYRSFARASHNDMIFECIRYHEQFVACLSGRTEAVGSFEDATFDEAESLGIIARSGVRTFIGHCEVLKQLALFVLRDIAGAQAAAERAAHWLPMFVGSVNETTHHTFAALTLTAAYADTPVADQPAVVDRVRAVHGRLEQWAKDCPENFAHPCRLVEAELARIEGRPLDALRLYEQAVRSANDTGFVYFEAIGYELASHCSAAAGLDAVAHDYLRRAHATYARWGAVGKVSQLEARHPALRRQPEVAGDARGGVAERLDSLMVAKASQAISSEIMIDQLLQTVMRILLEAAGADRGVLLRPRGDKLVQLAEAVARDEQVTVRLKRHASRDSALPRSILDSVRRLHEPVLIDDTRQAGQFRSDPYLARAGSRSVLCLPVLHRSELVGVLYLENTLATHAFTPALQQVLDVLVAQAAISLENAELYADLDREVNDRRTAEEARRESEEELARHFALSDDVIATVGFDGYLKRVNPSFERVIGYSQDELAERELLSFVHPDDRAETERRLLLVREGNVPVRVDNRFVCSDGSARWLEWAFIGEPGRELSFGIGRDVTERRRVEEEQRRLELELRQAQKMEAIGRLAGGVAHDFNNMLTVISGFNHSLLSVLPEDSPLREDALEIARASGRASELTQQLLAFSRHHVGLPQILDLNAVVLELVRMLRRLIGTDIRLVTDLAPDLGYVRADAGQIEQVVVNLVLNARDAMPSGGTLALTTSRVVIEPGRSASGRLSPGPYVRLAVSDDGSGMDSETLARVFEPFFTTKDLGRGTGLGLASVFAIVEQSGGRIFVESDVGSGTTFEIYLPETDQVAAAVLQRPVPKPAAARGTVLAVDDEDSVRRIVVRALREDGYTVLEAGTGAAALAVWLEQVASIDVLVSDIMMPGGVDGVELANRIAADRPGVAIVLTSGYVSNGGGRLPPGAVFLPKPFTAGTLLAAVRQAVEGAPAARPGLTGLQPPEGAASSS